MIVDISENIGRRDYMEDRFCVEPHFHDGWSFFGVFDGHSGDKVSHFLKFHMKDILRESMEKHPNNMTDAAEDAFYNASKAIDVNVGITCGSTACIILIKNDRIVSINVGDSRAIMGSTRPEVKTVPLTDDHKPDVPHEEQRIRDAGGFVIRDFMGTARTNGMLAMSRSVGDFFMFPHVIGTPEVKEHDMSAHDIFVVATDGVWDVFSNDELIQTVREGAKSKDLIQRAMDKGSMDNMTVILLQRVSGIPSEK